MVDFTSSRAFRVAGPTAFAEAGITHNDVDHLMIYDAFFRLSIDSFEDLGFIPRGEAGAFSAARNTVPGVPGTAHTAGRPGSRSTPMAAAFPIFISACTAYTRYRKSVRQMRGTALAQIPRRPDPVCHGVGGMFVPPAPSSCRMNRREPQI